MWVLRVCCVVAGAAVSGGGPGAPLIRRPDVTIVGQVVGLQLPDASQHSISIERIGNRTPTVQVLPDQLIDRDVSEGSAINRWTMIDCPLPILMGPQRSKPQVS
jgi:hypothetical protein